MRCAYPDDRKKSLKIINSFGKNKYGMNIKFRKTMLLNLISKV